MAQPKPRCTVQDCEAPHRARGYCRSHYRRWRLYGDAMAIVRQRYEPSTCAIADCERPRRKRDWCEMHYARWRKNGSVEDSAQSWVRGEFAECLTCGGEIVGEYGRKRYCSRSCAVMYSRRGKRPTEKACGACGGPIDLTARHPSGRLKYASVSSCRACARSVNLSRFLPLIVERDGASCGICSDPVDLEAEYPDPFSPSVDHIMPKSKGGPHIMENFQLAHLRCNIRKQNRV